MTLRRVRLLQLLGILIAVAGLTGYWLNRDIQRTVLDDSARAVLGVEKEEFQASFVVAGRDLDYTQSASPCVWRGGRCERARAGSAVYGSRTDTILYVHMIGNDVYIVGIPRDIFLDDWQTKVNAMYAYQGAEGVKRAVSDLVGLPIDYYAIINIDIFEGLVDAIGGVDVTIPYDMYHYDAAAGLEIDFSAGPRHLNGEDASKFVRYRDTVRGDLDRIDNVKMLAYAMLERVKELNVRAVGALPRLTATFLEDVETNASPALLADLLPRLADLEIHTLTLPTCCDRREGDFGYVLGVDPSAVETLLADTFGGTPREMDTAPEVPLLVTNRSGVPGLARTLSTRLEAMGVQAPLYTREADFDPTPTRILATGSHWEEADYYASLMHVGQQQVDRISVDEAERMERDRDEADVGEAITEVGIEIVLGGDVSMLPRRHLHKEEIDYRHDPGESTRRGSIYRRCARRQTRSRHYRAGSARGFGDARLLYRRHRRIDSATQSDGGWRQGTAQRGRHTPQRHRRPLDTLDTDGLRLCHRSPDEPRSARVL